MSENTTLKNDTSDAFSGKGLLLVELVINLIFSVVGIAITSLNGVVIAGFWKEKTVRETAGSVFIQNLAISDCLTGLFACYVAVLNLCGYANEYEYLFRMGFICAFLLASVCFLLYLTADRYLKVVMHLRYAELVTPRKHGVLCVVTWFICLMVGFLPLMGWHNSQVKSFSFFETFASSYIVLVIVLGQIPSCCLVITYVKLYHVSKEHRRQISAQGSDMVKDMKTTSDIIRSILLLIGAYIVCWLPVALYSAVGVAKGRDPNQSRVPVFTLLVTLGIINSLLNPLIYATKIPEIRVFFRQVCCSCGNFKITPVTGQASVRRSAKTVLGSSTN